MVAPAQHAASARARVAAPRGAVLSATAYGPADAELTVVLIHGWALSSRIWTEQIDGVLAAHETARLETSVRIVTYDHRGHGGSTACADGDGTVTQMADDLVCVLNELVPEGPVVLVGHSLGGMTIMALAEQRPELFGSRIVGCVLVATSAGSPKGVRSKIPFGRTHFGQTVGMVALNRDARARTAQRTAGKRSRPPLRPRAAFMRWLLCGPDATADQVWLSLKLVHDTPAATLPAFYQTFLSHDRVRHLAALRSIPVAVVAGSHDRLTPLGEARVLSRALPDASFTVLPRAGHMLPLERAAEVVDAILEVVQSVPRQ